MATLAHDEHRVQLLLLLGKLLKSSEHGSDIATLQRWWPRQTVL